MQNFAGNIRLETYRYGCEIYRESNTLRSRILLESLGRSEPASDYDFPDIDIYLGAFLGERLIGTLILTPLDAKTVRMRQLAVDENFRGSGIGKALVEKSEAIARSHGFSLMMLHARVSVLEFYQKLGYERAGERFFEIEIPHWLMQKKLK
ncbi:MAG: GNAT family N-acetyltransferase [Candidatus Neomarinimicrobiota bacterium]|jgi:ribosomal protein S18 acetylase RimI-like enzyme|nr:GNAT family N-acetyltransferase [Candidatus Neomarinimicrobiota bacterium]MDD3965991.1 GNAT family N-acetyltransferase [Candidatus Neomarinimicrobiota bacterium]MDX9779867.1 GNAT family N-acetyltransferase [bacterium]